MATGQSENAREPCMVFDWTEAESVSAAVISAVADVSDEDPVKMEPLHSVLDPDSIDSLLDSRGVISRRSDVRVEFSFNGYGVQVSETGEGFVF